METIAYLKCLLATTIAAHAIGLTTAALQFGIPPMTLLYLFAEGSTLSLTVSLTIFGYFFLRDQKELLTENALSLLLLVFAGMLLGDGFSAPSLGTVQGFTTGYALMLSLIVNIAAATTTFLILYVFTESHSYLKKRTMVMLEDLSNGLHLRAFDQHGRYAGFDASREEYVTEIPGSYLHHGEEGTELLSLPLAVSSFTILVDASTARNTLGTYRLSVTTIVNWEVKDVRRIHYLIKQGSIQAYDIKTEIDGKVWMNSAEYLPELVERAKKSFSSRRDSGELLNSPPRSSV